MSERQLVIASAFNMSERQLVIASAAYIVISRILKRNKEKKKRQITIWMHELYSSRYAMNLLELYIFQKLHQNVPRRFCHSFGNDKTPNR